MLSLTQHSFNKLYLLTLGYMFRFSRKHHQALPKKNNILYFSTDNAYLMYNAHPKLFRHCFCCIDNAHDVFFDR